MKIRKITPFALALLSIALLNGCGKNDATAVQMDVEYTVYNDELMGLRLELPAKEYADWTVLYGPISQEGEGDEYTPVDGSSFFFVPDGGIDLFTVQYYHESDWDAWLANGMTAEQVTGVAQTQELGRTGGMVYLCCVADPDENAVSEENREAFDRVKAMLPRIIDSITLTERAGSDMETFPTFSATTLDGETVSNDFFANNKMTLVNVWGTYCGPCIAEMATLQELSQLLPEGTGIVGIAADAMDENRVTLAQQIVEETGVSYPNWAPDEALQQYLAANIAGTPTMLFIDANGQLVGDPIIGRSSVDTYLEALAACMGDDADTPAANAGEENAQDALTPELSGTSGSAAAAGAAADTDDRMEQLRATIDMGGNVRFSATTPFGDAIDSSVFASYDLTMINVWGTLCKPCIKEMPEIQRLYQDMEPQGVNVIGFIANSESDRVEKAAEILTAQGITYPNAVFDDETSGAISSQVSGYPTTIFVDSSGNVVGEQFAGDHNYDEYAAAIQERLEELSQ